MAACTGLPAGLGLRDPRRPVSVSTGGARSADGYPGRVQGWSHGKGGTQTSTTTRSLALNLVVAMSVVVLSTAGIHRPRRR